MSVKNFCRPFGLTELPLADIQHTELIPFSSSFCLFVPLSYFIFLSNFSNLTQFYIEIVIKCHSIPLHSFPKVAVSFWSNKSWITHQVSESSVLYDTRKQEKEEVVARLTKMEKELKVKICSSCRILTYHVTNLGTGSIRKHNWPGKQKWRLDILDILIVMNFTYHSTIWDKPSAS